MKKMNVIPLIMSVFLLFSCTNQEQIVLEPIAEKSVSKEKQEKENEYLLGQQVFYAASLEKIEQLESQLVELSGKKESGDKEAINQIEKTQKEVNKYKIAADYFYSMRPPGLRPRPLPPVPCRNDKANCNPIINNLQQIVIGDNEIEVTNLDVVDEKGNFVGKGQMGENEYGRTVNMEVKEFEGQATMQTEILMEDDVKISLDIPVRGN